ncbi:MAG: caspase family protein [Chitinophagales bacterium]
MKTNLLNTFVIFIFLILCVPSFAQVWYLEVDIPKFTPLDKTPPIIQWILPSDTVNSSKYSFKLELTDSPYPVAKVRTRLNKQNWKEHKNPFSLEEDQKAKKEIDKELAGKGSDDRTMGKHQILPFSLQEGRNEIEISVTNQGPATTDTIFTVFYVPAIRELPTLHLVTVGVGSYKFEDIDTLDYPAKDAIAIDSIFTYQDRLYKEIKRYPLRDEEATKKAIVSLIAKVKNCVDKNDAIIAFFSGHGDKHIIPNIEAEIRFMPHDFDKNDRENTGILNDYIISEIKKMQCNSFIIFDACHSGSVAREDLLTAKSGNKNSKKMTKEIDRRQRKNVGENVLLNASEDEAFEHSKWKHGALTKALLEAFEGRIDEEFIPTEGDLYHIMSKNGKYITSIQYLKEMSKDGLVDAKELLIYVNHRVRELVRIQRGKQEPVFEGKGDFFLYQMHK